MGKDKWMVLGILLVLGGVIYWMRFRQSPVEPVYEKWSQAVEVRDCDTLQALAEGDAKDWAENFCSSPPSVPSNSQMAADQSADINLPLSKTEKTLYMLRDVKSQITNPDGTVTLTAKETHLPVPGSLKKAAGPRMVTLKFKLEGEDWKVVDYQSKDL